MNSLKPFHPNEELPPAAKPAIASQRPQLQFLPAAVVAAVSRKSSGKVVVWGPGGLRSELGVWGWRRRRTEAVAIAELGSDGRE